MKKIFKKENIFVLLSYIITFVLIYMVVTRGEYIFGSKIDFESQHFLIPNYFRELFYSTHHLFPDFAFNLSSGINIYYLSYYGLLSPIILFSYLLPQISMMNYIIMAMSTLTVLSSFMMYLYLKKNKFSTLISFLGGFIFLLASPIIFHAHRHIMFVDYMPFLILGMFGVDRYFEKGKSSLLIISIFLMIMTSYYYSVGGVVMLFILGIYKYLQKVKKFEFKKFIKKISKFIIPFIIAILMGAIIILPTLYVLKSGRIKTNVVINFWTLFLPKFSFKYLLYNAYSMGMTVIALISCIYITIMCKKENRFLGLVILCISIFPIFNFVLNGFMYVDSKSLIPFIPLVVLITCVFLNKLFNSKINYKYLLYVFVIIIIAILLELLFTALHLTNSSYIHLFPLLLDFIFTALILLFYKKVNKKWLVVTYLIINLITFSLIINLSEVYISKDESQVNDDQLIKSILKKDTGIYRINNYVSSDLGMNRISTIKQYQTVAYSSTNNKNYDKIYYDIFNNEMPNRNSFMINFSSNILFNNYMGEKYIITSSQRSLSLPNYKVVGDYKIYKNNDAFPIGYATNNVLNINDYKKLKYPDNVVNLLNNAVVDEKTNNKVVHVTKESLNYDVLGSSDLTYKKSKNGYKIKSKVNGILAVRIREPMYKKVWFLRFTNYNNPLCRSKEIGVTDIKDSNPSGVGSDLYVKINGIKNKLTCKSWKYCNNNYTFDYVIKKRKTLFIQFGEGEYDLRNFQVYSIDYSDIRQYNKQVDPFVITKLDDKGIDGHINVTKAGYFIIQIPYDSGFSAKIDGRQVNVKKVNQEFVGFKINKGYHNISIMYKAPLKNMGLIISAIGFIILIGYFFYENGNLVLKKR